MNIRILPTANPYILILRNWTKWNEIFPEGLYLSMLRKLQVYLQVFGLRICVLTIEIKFIVIAILQGKLRNEFLEVKLELCVFYHTVFALVILFRR